MIIRSVRVQRYRCIRDETLDCDQLTALVGANGAGKSSFLRALALFYQPSSPYSAADFWNGDTSHPIVITVAYSELTDDERRLFDTRMSGDLLMVEKELSWPAGRASQKYYGRAYRNPAFVAVRSAPRAPEKRNAYRELIRSGQYPNLPTDATTLADIDAALESWEGQHPNQCEEVRDDGQFFGFKEVGQARLERFTKFLFVPAVRDATEDGVEGKGSVLTELLDLAVRNALAEREDVRTFQEDTKRRFDALMSLEQLPELTGLRETLANTLRRFAPDAQLDLRWDTSAEIVLPLPRGSVHLIEDGYAAAVEQTGHGLQRAFILTMLQHLALASGPSAEAGRESVKEERRRVEATGNGTGDPGLPAPNLILGIEEPELYQHPIRQRYLSKILHQLATGRMGGLAARTQVLFCTHSPLFVDIQRFDHIRLLSKVQQPGSSEPKEARVFRATLQDVAKTLDRAQDTPSGTFTAETLAARLHIMTSWLNEGFFANVVVLVEGEGDRAVVMAVSQAVGCDLEGAGISVIPCGGKTAIDKPAAIFRTMGIDVYAIWDSDEGQRDPKPEINRTLLRLFGATAENFPVGIGPTFACFRHDMNMTLREEIREDLYRALLTRLRAELAIPADRDPEKNPVLLAKLVEEAAAAGQIPRSIGAIVDAIMELRQRGQAG